MSALVQDLLRRTREMQTKRPADMERLRKRMGAKKQNASIQIYAYIDLRSTMDVLYQAWKNVADKSVDFTTLKKCVCDWLEFIGGRAPVCFNLTEFSDYALRAVAELKAAFGRAEAAELLDAIQRYTCELSHWVDLDFPWHEVGVAYAAAKGDPAPVT
jgi:hypothetical protein